MTTPLLKPPFPLPTIVNAPRADSRHYKAWVEVRRFKPWLPVQRKIEWIVVHSTQGTHSLRWLTTDPSNDTSAHRLIGPTGICNNLVDLVDIAYHAGVCDYGVSNLNSLGMEIENPSKTAPPYPEDLVVPYPQLQVVSAAYTLAEWMFSYGLGWDRVVRHGDVATPRGRRTDPDHFDWAIFRAVTEQWLGFFRTVPVELHGAVIL